MVEATRIFLVIIEKNEWYRFFNRKEIYKIALTNN